MARLQRRPVRQERAGVRAFDGSAPLQPTVALPRVVSGGGVAAKPLESALVQRSLKLAASQRYERGHGP